MTRNVTWIHESDNSRHCDLISQYEFSGVFEYRIPARSLHIPSTMKTTKKAARTLEGTFAKLVTRPCDQDWADEVAVEIDSDTAPTAETIRETLIARACNWSELNGIEGGEELMDLALAASKVLDRELTKALIGIRIDRLVPRFI